MLVVPAGVALHDEPADVRRLRRGEEVLRPLRPQPVGDGEPPVETAKVRLAAERRHLVDDRIRPGADHGRANGGAVEPVDDGRLRTELLQTRRSSPGLRRRDHLVTAEQQLRHEPPADRPGAACNEHAHLGASFVGCRRR